MTHPDAHPPVRTEIDGDVWRVTLDRPEAGNALDPQMAAELTTAIRERPEQTRVVLLLGNGPRFCVGGDVQSFASAADPGAFVGQLAHDWHEVIRLVLACPVPVVAEDGVTRRVRACVDGPVIRGDRVHWGEVG